MSSMLNLGSLVLGLLAWILPIINLTRYKKDNQRNWSALSILSISACAISLCFQVFYANHLVIIEDWSALMDISGTMAFVSAFLLIVTVILNAITIVVYRKIK
ncbi:hypothetical protein [Cytobacillus massiliigabonensis]|uniref:hypothetical protein n=1 Tax=Cytobacillus massiliigabonensis TaxID=1871011 RepID=UPI000C8477CB|nr:hypothetical protein [Cytobacillus massiliigabonensis]